MVSKSVSSTAGAHETFRIHQPHGYALSFVIQGARERGGEPFRSGRGRVELRRARRRFGGLYSESSPCSRGMRNACQVKINIYVLGELEKG